MAAGDPLPITDRSYVAEAREEIEANLARVATEARLLLWAWALLTMAGRLSILPDWLAKLGDDEHHHGEDHGANR